jgi:putative MFS transporter
LNPPGVGLTARIDALPLLPFHRRLVVAAGLGWMFDAFDSGLIAFVLAVLYSEWSLAPAQIGWLGSAGLVGMFLGAAAAGTLADRFGRRPLFTWTLLLFSVATGLCGLAGGFATLLTLRIVVGAGLGGELPVASTLVSELSPAHVRGRMVVILESFWTVGWALAAIGAYFLIPRLGWRFAFFLGALPALYVLYLRRRLPESPRFLLAAGRAAEAEAIVRALEREAGRPTQVASLAEPAVQPAPGWQELWQPPLARRTIMLWILWFTMVFSYYGIFTWLPSLLVAAGHQVVRSFEYSLWITLAQLPGYASAALLVDRLGRKRTLVLYMAACAGAALMFGTAADPASIVLWGCLISFFNLGAWGVVYAYTPELYPTRLRGTGAGWAVAAGRIGGIVAPLLVGWLLAAGPAGHSYVFAMFGAVIAAGALAVGLLGEETRGRALESISAEA